jgi:N-acetylmuramic acid 6-phosphate etherase
MTVLVGADLGKTGCRVAVMVDGRPLPAVEGPGSRGLAEPGGAEEALACVLAAVTTALASAGVPQRPVTVDGLVVGAAGAEAAPGAAASLAVGLLGALDARSVGVTSDSVTAHAGALGGRAGTVLAAGTGAVALGVGRDGRVQQADGWGQWLGDDGSGAWIGREALRAALLAREGRGPATLLTEAALERFGDLTALPTALSRSGNVARTAAVLVPAVVRAAEAGDARAADILRSAGRLLAATTAAAADAVGEETVTLVGGLAAVEPVVASWREHLPSSLRVEPAAGTSLDGALLLARRTDLPHEPRVRRVDGAGATATGTADAGPPDVDVDLLATEQVQPGLEDLDQRSPEELVGVLLAAEAGVPSVVAAAQAEIARAVGLVEAAFAAGGRLVYVGAGTPGRLAALDAAECPPTFGTSPDRVVALLAGGDRATAAAVEGAEDDAEAGAAAVQSLPVSANDVVVGITASGRTPYVLAALESARSRGAATVAVVNNAGSPARAFVDVTVELLTGPEVLAGSTRLTAGTAQKLTLNLLSTGAMIRSGRTYGGWMVDVVASNEKLRRRARRILREAAGVDDATAGAALERADGQTKTALVMLLAGVDVDDARARLAAAGGRVRAVLRMEAAS